MKRREFLTASLGVAGLSLPALGRGQDRACGPGFVGAAGGSATTLACGTASGGSAPAWFKNMADRAWVAFDSGPGKDITGQPTYDGLLGTDRPRGLFPYSGACVHGYRQSLLIYGGGHTNGGDNGIYEFSLVDADSQAGSPRWKTFRTRGAPIWPEHYKDAPDTQFAKWDDPNYWWERWADGTPVDVHTYQDFVWEPITDSVWHLYQSGLFTAGPRNNAPSWWGTPARETVWKIDTATRTWTQLARSDKTAANGYTSVYQGTGPTLFNGQHKDLPPHILKLQAGTNISSRHYIVDVRTGQRTIPASPRIGTMSQFSSVAAVAPEHGIIAWCAMNDNRLFLIDMHDYSRPENGIPRPVQNWPTGNWAYSGLVWHAASNAFFAWGEKSGVVSRASLFKLTQPNRQWWSDTWEWTEVTAAPGTVMPTAPFESATYGRFNIVNDVGGSGRDAIVLINNSDGPTFVYKLPAAGVG